MHAEAELVLCAVQCELGTEQADDTLASLLQANLDWNAVANLATRNGVLPLVYRRLSTVAAARTLPPLPEQLKTLFHVNAIRSHHLTAELLRLLKLLESHGVAAIPFKGPALAVLLHGDVTMRQFVDLDLFVRRCDVTRATAALLAAGYQTRFDSREIQWTNLFNAYENQFVRQRGQVTIDLHWGAAPDSMPFGPSLDQLWARVNESSLNGIAVRCLTLPDLLHVLCLQGCRDGWDKLSSVCSIAGIAQRMVNERDWKLLLDEAQACGTNRMVLLGLCLANQSLKVRFPAPIADMIAGNRALIHLARRLARAFFTHSNARRMLEQWGQQFIVPLKAIETRRGRVRYCLTRTFRPTLRDGEFVRLPKPLFPLYYVVRPVRLLLAAIADLVEQLRRWRLPER